MIAQEKFYFVACLLSNLSKNKKASLNILHVGKSAHDAFRASRQVELEKQNPEMEIEELLDQTHMSLKNTTYPEYMELKDGTRKFIELLNESNNNSYDVIYNCDFKYFHEPIVDKKSPLPSPIFLRGYLHETFELDGKDYFIHERLQNLLSWANLLNEKGYLLLEAMQIYSGRIPNNYIDPISEKILNSQGFYLNAFLQQVPNYQMRGKRRIGTILLISRYEMNGTIFVADLSENVDLASNFFAGNNSKNDEQNLTQGYFLNREDFYTLEQLRNTERAEKTIFFNYEGYKQVLFKDLVGPNNKDDEDAFDEILSTLNDVTDDPEHDDMRLLAFWSRTFDGKKLNTHNLAICLSSEEDDWAKLTSRYDYMFFIVPKSIHARYLEIFFESELGRQLYQSNLKIRDRNKRLSTDEIRNLRILIPEKEELLENTVKAYEKLIELNKSVGKIKNNFLTNPKQSVNQDIEKLNDMLAAAGSLTKSDEIYAIIKRKEGPDTEFKETFRLPVGGGKGDFDETSKKLQATVIKVINSFINSYGGDLLIGVSDDHKIKGLDNELNHYFSKKSKSLIEQQDKFLLHFNGILNKAFLEVFVRENINYEFVDVADTCVLRVECKPTYEPCLIQDKAKLTNYLGSDYYYRTGSESVPLTKQEKADYMVKRVQSKNLELSE
jgi:hypothetical protein